MQSDCNRKGPETKENCKLLLLQSVDGSTGVKRDAKLVDRKNTPKQRIAFVEPVSEDSDVSNEKVVKWSTFMSTIRLTV